MLLETSASRAWDAHVRDQQAAYARVPKRWSNERALELNGQRQVLTDLETAVLGAALMQATTSRTSSAIALELRSGGKGPSAGGVKRIAARLLCWIFVGGPSVASQRSATAQQE